MASSKSWYCCKRSRCLVVRGNNFPAVAACLGTSAGDLRVLYILTCEKHLSACGELTNLKLGVKPANHHVGLLLEDPLFQVLE